MGLCQAEGVLVLRRLSEKFRAKNKLFFVSVDLQKAFDQMPREVIRFALRQKGVPEYLVNGVMSLYKGCKTASSVDGELSSSLSVKVGVHLGSTLSPLLDGCSDRRCEGWFINGVVVCRRSCFVWGIIK